TYYVRVVYTDTDGIRETTNCNGGSTSTSCTQTTSATTGPTVNQSGLIDQAATNVFATRAGSYYIRLTGQSKAMAVTLNLGSYGTRALNTDEGSSPNTTCDDKGNPPVGGNTFRYLWDGKD